MTWPPFIFKYKILKFTWRKTSSAQWSSCYHCCLIHSWKSEFRVWARLSSSRNTQDVYDGHTLQKRSWLEIWVLVLWWANQFTTFVSGIIDMMFRAYFGFVVTTNRFFKRNWKDAKNVTWKSPLNSSWNWKATIYFKMGQFQITAIYKINININYQLLFSFRRRFDATLQFVAHSMREVWFSSAWRNRQVYTDIQQTTHLAFSVKSKQKKNNYLKKRK